MEQRGLCSHIVWRKAVPCELPTMSLLYLFVQSDRRSNDLLASTFQVELSLSCIFRSLYNFQAYRALTFIRIPPGFYYHTIWTAILVLIPLYFFSLNNIKNVKKWPCTLFFCFTKTLALGISIQVSSNCSSKLSQQLTTSPKWMHRMEHFPLSLQVVCMWTDNLNQKGIRKISL